MADRQPPLAVSMGEPAGIGTEVLIKSYARMRSIAQTPRFFLIDDPMRVARILREAKAPFQVASIEAPGDALGAFEEALPVLPVKADRGTLDDIEPGKASLASAPAVMEAIRQAVAFARSGEASGVVTLPIQKAILQIAGFPHPGHTEFLGALTADVPVPQGEARGALMMLAAGNFRTVPVTVHQSLASVPASLTIDAIVEAGEITAQSLRRDFGIAKPRLAVAGLNPHAGESGKMGTEEQDIIEPAIAALRERNVDAQGPWPADTMFHEEARAQYDAALAMYHDQALVPIKTVAFHEAVNVTLGLPIVRTSPDHGTGFPIAGKGVARPDSTMAAILMAARMAAARTAHA